MAITVIAHTYHLKGGEQEAVERRNPLLDRREPIVVFMKDGSTKMKIGDGFTYFNDLPFIADEIAKDLSTLVLRVDGLEADYEAKIETAKIEAIQEAVDAQAVKTVSDEFTLTSGELSVAEIAQSKITGLTEVAESINKKIGGIKVAGVAVAATGDIVDIPAATSTNFGVVKLGAEFQTNADTNELEIKQLNVNRLVQDEGDILVLNGGTASDLT